MAAAASMSSVLCLYAQAVLSRPTLEQKSIGELRLLAKERGLRGDTKAELIRLLITSTPAPTNGAASISSSSTASFSSPASTTLSSLPSDVSYSRRQLETMPLAQLRAMARVKGLFGGSRSELIAALMREPIARSPSPTPRSSSPPAPAPAPAVVAAAVPVESAPLSSASDRAAMAKQLQSQPISVLRSMARQRGVRGDTKAELVKALLDSMPLPATPAPAPASPTPAAAPASSAAAAAAVPSVSPQVLSRQLQARPLSALRAMAAAKGVQGNNKEQLIRAIIAASTATAVQVTEVRSASATLAQQLSSKPLSELRAMARARGLQGNTKAELLKLLTQEPPSTAYSAPSFAAAAASTPSSYATATATATATGSPFSSSASSFSIPFQSDIPAAGVAIQPSQTSVATSSSSSNELADLLFGPSAEEDSLAEQATFLRNVLVGGIGIAVLPLLLPGQMNTSSLTSTGFMPRLTPMQPSSSPTVATPNAPAVIPPAEPAPEIRALSPEEFCSSLPASLLSQQAAKFCQALTESP